MMRNIEVQQEAEEEKSKALTTRLESLLFLGRNSGALSCVALHAYEPLVTVAGKDCFG
jgi:hypothetical protein